MIRIDDLKYYPSLSSEGANNLVGNKSSRVECWIDFTVREFLRATDQQRIYFASPKFDAQPNNYIDSIDNKPIFTDFKEGDLYEVFNTTFNNGFYTIIEKISDLSIRVDQVLVGEISSTATVELATPIKAIRYFFGIIENNEAINFDSKITGQQQQLTVSDYPTNTLVPESMIWNLPKEVQVKGATIERLQVGTLPDQQRFRIKHTIDVDPYTLPSRYVDSVNGIAPPYSRNGKSLKHVFEVQASEDFIDPNRIHKYTESRILGNLGWKGENFNGNETNYSVTNIEYFNDLSEVVPSLEVTTSEQRIEITIQNTVDSPFSDGNTPFTTNFSYSPETVGEFTNNGKTPLENFYRDQALNFVGDPATNGENFGSIYQTVKEVTATVDGGSPTQIIHLVVIVAMSTEFVADIGSRIGRKSFEFNIEVKNHLLTTFTSDLVTLPVALEQFYNDISDPTLATITGVFYKAYEDSDVDAGESTIQLRSEDNAIFEGLVELDRDGRTDDDITTRNQVVEMVIRNDVLGIENVLESYEVDFSTGGLDQTGESYVDFSEERSFKFPDGNQAKVISAQRRQDLDTGTLKAYVIKYPFLFRWDDFTALQGLNDAFFDPTKLNNGKNNGWNRLDTFTDWNFFFRLTANFIKNGNQIPIVSEVQMDTFTYLEDADWINETIKYFLGVTEITPAIVGYADTKVEITKEYDGAGTLPLASEVHWIGRIEVWLQGSIIGIRYLASWEDFTQYSWLKSVDNSNQVIKSLAGNVHKATFAIDHQKLIAEGFPEGTKLKVSGRIYDTINTGAIPANAKLTSPDAIPKTTSPDAIIKTTSPTP